MRCSDLHINVQDASGDRILAGDALTRDRTDWYQWVNNKGVYTFESGDLGRQREEEEDTHPEHVVGEVWRKKKKRKFKRTPSRFGRNGFEACRIYGSLEGNKVQGDFHITARGHGYMEFGEHLDHTGTFQFPFAHMTGLFHQQAVVSYLHQSLRSLILSTAAVLTDIFWQLSTSPT